MGAPVGTFGVRGDVAVSNSGWLNEILRGRSHGFAPNRDTLRRASARLHVVVGVVARE